MEKVLGMCFAEEKSRQNEPSYFNTGFARLPSDQTVGPNTTGDIFIFQGTLVAQLFYPDNDSFVF